MRGPAASKRNSKLNLRSSGDGVAAAAWQYTALALQYTQRVNIDVHVQISLVSKLVTERINIARSIYENKDIEGYSTR